MNQDNFAVNFKHENPRHEKMLVVNWQYGNICSLKCRYCPKHVHSGTRKWVELPRSKLLIDRIVSHYKDQLGMDIYFDFTGGEITLCQDLVELVKYVRQKKCYAGIITNGKRNLDYWKEIAPYLDHISISYHPSGMYKDQFFQAVEYLYDKVSCHINIMMHPDYFNECEELGLKIVRSVRNTSISFQVLYVILGLSPVLMKYTPEQMARLKQLENEIQIPWDKEPFTYRGKMKQINADQTEEALTVPTIIMNELNRWKSWKCWSGLEQMIINDKQEIFRAWCMQDKIGMIGDDSIQFPAHPVLCGKEICQCAMDILCTKEKVLQSRTGLKDEE